MCKVRSLFRVMGHNLHDGTFSKGKKGNFVLMIVKEIPTEPPCSLPIIVQVCSREEKINS